MGFFYDFELRHLLCRGSQKSSKNKMNIIRTFLLVRNFPFRVAANLLEHSEFLLVPL